MLLIDHDEAEIGEGQEERGARPDHDTRLAAGDRAPDAFALALGQSGMPLGGPRTEALGEAIQELGGESNLGQEHERLAPRP